MLLGATVSGAEELRISSRFTLDGTFHHIASFTVDAQGSLIIADSDAPSVVKVDQVGRRIATFSRPGSSYCEVQEPSAVTVTNEGFLVFDMGRQHLLAFSTDGECLSDQLARTFQTAGPLTRRGTRLVAGGSLLKKKRGERCVFFSTDSAGSPSSAVCLLNITDDRRWLLYGREYVAASRRSVYYMNPYEPVLYTSDGLTGAKAVPLSGLGVPTATLPTNERAIRMDRASFYKFYNGQTLVEGIAATRSGIVVVTRTPGNAARLDVRYFRDGATTPSAATTLSIPPVIGAFPVVVRGYDDDRVCLLVAKGTYPSLRYEAVIFQVR
jgi:hypothetical protein